MSSRKVIIFVLGILFGYSSFQAQSLIPAESVSPSEGALFGFKSDVSGGWAIISSPRKNIGTRICEGSVTFLRLTDGEWKVFQEISTPNNNNHLSNFGSDVVIEGNTAAISAIGDFEDGRFSGAVYIYNFNLLSQQWEYSQKLKASDANLGQRFGQSIDLKGNLLVVGAHNADGNQEKSGAAYVFQYENEENGWVSKQKLISIDGMKNDFFGFEVHIMNPEYIAIGAYNADNADATIQRAGATYIFKSNDGGSTWTQNANLRIPDAQFSDLFGFSISSGPVNKDDADNRFNGVLFVGAPGTVNENGKTGSVYFFTEEADGWKNTFELVEPEIGHNDHFGYSVVAGDTGNLFVGANRFNTGSTKKIGKVYFYDTFNGGGTGVASQNTLSGSLLSEYDHYGSHISVDKENIIVSRPFADLNNTNNSGAVDFFRMENIINSETQPDQLYVLKQNAPNPSQNGTVIEYELRQRGFVKLSLYSISGKLIDVLVDEYKNFGVYQVRIPSNRFAPGVYLYKIEINDFENTLKMILD